MAQADTSLTRYAVLVAKALILTALGVAFVIGLAATRCPRPHTGEPQHLDEVLLNSGFVLYAQLMERAADRYRRAGDATTSIRLLGRALSAQIRFAAPDDGDVARLRAKHQAQLDALPPGQRPVASRVKISATACGKT